MPPSTDGWGADGANLYYARAGLAWMAERQNYLLFDPVPQAASADAGRWGWTVGAGLEHRVAAQWSLRLDYQYLGFDGTAFALATPRALDFDAHAHVFTAGVNWYPDAVAAPGDAAVFAAPDEEPGAWAFEVAARLFAAGGNMKKDFDGVPDNENSRLTYQGLPMLAGEIFARADHRSGWFAQGFHDLGVVNGGTLYDEDTPTAGFGNAAWSNTISRVRKGSFAAQGIDAGFNVIDRDDVRLGVFAGYSHLRLKAPAFGCEQLANNNYLCKPAFPTGYNIITEAEDWHAARLGVNSRLALTDALSVQGEAAYLPYAFLNGVDQHLARGIVFADRGTGDGVQLQGLVDYAITGNISLGLGARYWEWHSGRGADVCHGGCNDSFPNQSYVQPPWGAPHDLHLFGGFAQVAYRFGRLARGRDAPPPPEDDFAWDGFYLGAQAGARASQASLRTDCLGSPCSNGEARRNPNEVPMANAGGYFGGLAGYLSTIAPGWLMGVEGDVGWANNTHAEQNVWLGYLPNTRARPNDPATLRQDWDGSLRLRAGTLLTPTTFAYVTTGLALQGMSLNATCHGPPSYWCLADRSESAGQAQFGYTLGLGAETAIGTRLSARLEYRYSDFGSYRHQFFAGVPADAITLATRVADQRLLAGVIYRP